LSAWDPAGLLTSFTSLDPFARRSGLRIDDHGDELVVTADMPGVDDADVDVTLDRGELRIAGKRSDRAYRYACMLGDVDASHIRATLEHGVLTVIASKRASAKPRKIPVVVKSKRGSAKRRFRFFKK
jgi:HSP20 family molecular chaperone IbpA